MKALIRLICEDCLRSLEWSSNSGGSPPSVCPHCGGAVAVDGSLGDADSEADDSPVSFDTLPREAERDLRDTAPLVPETVGRFQLRTFLGGGGFGHVYRAYDPRLDRDVALKVLKDARPTPRAVERFFREARAAAQLDHPNIVALHDAGREESRCWIAYQFVPGQTLAQRFEGKPIRAREAAKIARSLADALHHAHVRGVFHRDIKPSNIIFDERGEARLTDFGLARRASVDPTLTREGVVLGTPAYMSPEQAAGQGHLVDERSDVYSLGVIFYELLCGRRPVDLPSGIPLWRFQSRMDVVPPRRFLRSVPHALDRVCRRALAERPADRYPGARAMADEIGDWLDRPSPRPIPTALGVATIFALGALLGTLASRASRPGNTEKTQESMLSKQQDQSRHNRIKVLTTIHPPVSTKPWFRRPGSILMHSHDCLQLRGLEAGELEELADPRQAASQGLLPCQLCLGALPAQ
jgi:serine/threonine protein kinase